MHSYVFSDFRSLDLDYEVAVGLLMDVAIVAAVFFADQDPVVVVFDTVRHGFSLCSWLLFRFVLMLTTDKMSSSFLQNIHTSVVFCYLVCLMLKFPVV